MGRFKKNTANGDALHTFAPSFNKRQFNSGISAFDPLTKTRGISSIIRKCIEIV